MLTGTRKLWQFLRYFFRATKSWRWPRRSEVLIFDACNQEVLLQYLDRWKPEVLHVRGEQVNIPVLLASLLARGKKSEVYKNRYIQHVRPRVVITIIDTSPWFYSIKARHQGTTTISIQNGIRSGGVFEGLEHSLRADGRLEVDYLMTFGHGVSAEYAKYVQGDIIPIGSVKNNLVPRCQARQSGTIAFVSQYRDSKDFEVNGTWYAGQSYFERVDRVVLGFLVDYVNRRGKELYIVPCSGYHRDDTLKREQEYFNRIAGRSCTFSEWGSMASSYEAIDSAEVVVSVDSTLGYESAARGNKTAIFSIRPGLLDLPDRGYGWPDTYPDEGPFWVNRPDTAAFERILDHLFAISDDQWRAELAANAFADIMAFDPGNTILQSVLECELGASGAKGFPVAS
jgi:surface carbohydrate biosynthesis protein